MRFSDVCLCVLRKLDRENDKAFTFSIAFNRSMKCSRCLFFSLSSLTSSFVRNTLCTGSTSGPPSAPNQLKYFLQRSVRISANRLSNFSRFYFNFMYFVFFFCFLFSPFNVNTVATCMYKCLSMTRRSIVCAQK